MWQQCLVVMPTGPHAPILTIFLVPTLSYVQTGAMQGSLAMRKIRNLTETFP
jgi:hypothetical protein